MKERRRALARRAALFGLALASGSCAHGQSQAAPASLVGRPAPPFALARLDRPDQTFGPDRMRGQVWLLNVWASWCVACRKEHPLLLDLARRGALPIVGLDYMDTAPAATKWLAGHGDPYELSVLDARGKTGIDYGVYSVPETFVVDKGGVVRLKLSGPVTAAWIETTLTPLIKTLNAR